MRRHRSMLLFELKSLHHVGVARGRNHRAQIVDHEVEQFVVGAVDQFARTTNHKAQVAWMALAVLLENTPFVEEPLGLCADEADESGVGDFAIEPDMHADYRRTFERANARD